MRDSTDTQMPKLLLVHDGELRDVASLIGSLGVGHVERRGGPHPEDNATVWDLVVASSRRGVALDFSHQDTPPAVIAILEHDSRTLRNQLQRVGIRTLVRRPVHPAALRALILHSLYKGPEKRRTPRVSVGAEVQIRAGWRSRKALLADLSRGGCRLLLDKPVPRGKSLTLTVPAEVSGDKPFTLKARVLEEGSCEDDGFHTHQVTARFEGLAIKQLRRLSATLARYAGGPARYAAASSDDAQRLATLGAEAGRVLVGREPSLSSMRVDPNPDLAVGMEVHLGAHLAEHSDPVRLRARVERDDGDRGLLLRFDPVDQTMRDGLKTILDSLLKCGKNRGGEVEDGLGGPILITEILAAV